MLACKGVRLLGRYFTQGAVVGVCGAVLLATLEYLHRFVVVPLVLMLGVSFVVFRRRALYPAQLRTRCHSSANRRTRPPIFVTADDSLQTATERMRANGWRELPVVTNDHQLVGMLHEEDIASVCVDVETQTGEARRRDVRQPNLARHLLSSRQPCDAPTLQLQEGPSVGASARCHGGGGTRTRGGELRAAARERSLPQ
jgi:hypothetical protein